jgi:hypothetical protein
VAFGVGTSGGAVGSGAAVGTARADEAEADTAQPVAAQLGGVSPEPNGDDAAAMEQLRQSRLKRWQAER